MDKEGLNSCRITPSGEWSEPSSLALWGYVDNSHPFRPGAAAGAVPGLGAALHYSDNNRAIHFDRAGQHWVVHTVSNGSWGAVAPLTAWGASIGPEWNIPFLGDGVGAALQVYAENFLADPRTDFLIPGKSHHQVLFNHDGTKVSIYTGSTGFSPVYDMVTPKE